MVSEINLQDFIYITNFSIFKVVYVYIYIMYSEWSDNWNSGESEVKHNKPNQTYSEWMIAV
jgi:hypothetical protein